MTTSTVALLFILPLVFGIVGGVLGLRIGVETGVESARTRQSKLALAEAEVASLREEVESFRSRPIVTQYVKVRCRRKHVAKKGAKRRGKNP